MTEAAVYHWKLHGHLHVWHYLPPVKGLAGWHLNADATACASLVDLIDRMLAKDEKSQMHIPVSVPTRMLVGPGHPWKPVSELFLRYSTGEVEAEFWHLEQGPNDALTLTVGTAKLREFRQALLNLPHWKDDFAIGPEINAKRDNNSAERARFAVECLWFWTKVE